MAVSDIQCSECYNTGTLCARCRAEYLDSHRATVVARPLISNRVAVGLILAIWVVGMLAVANA